MSRESKEYGSFFTDDVTFHRGPCASAGAPRRKPPTHVATPFMQAFLDLRYPSLDLVLGDLSLYVSSSSASNTVEVHLSLRITRPSLSARWSNHGASPSHKISGTFAGERRKYYDLSRALMAFTFINV